MSPNVRAIPALLVGYVALLTSGCQCFSPLACHGTCSQYPDRPLANMARHRLQEASGCGEIYLGAAISDPPPCCDGCESAPACCDECGPQHELRYCGPVPTLAQLWGTPYQAGPTCSCCSSGAHLQGYESVIDSPGYLEGGEYPGSAMSPAPLAPAPYYEPTPAPRPAGAAPAPAAPAAPAEAVPAPTADGNLKGPTLGTVHSASRGPQRRPTRR